MNGERSSQDVATVENLLVVQRNGRIMSRSVSQVYGRALLRAMAPTSSKSPLKELHVSFLSRDEAWTPNEIRKAARGVGMSDNFMFIDDGGKILSCRISCDYGVALLQSLQQSPGEASRTRSPMTQPADASASEIVNDRDMMWESPRHSSQHHNHAQAISSSPPPSVFETPASNYLGTLSDHILSSANRQPYDRDWMNKYGISEAWLLRGPQSKHTLDLLFKHGAIIPGDKLCITYQSPAGPVIKFAEVLHSDHNRRLDIRVARARAGFDGIVYDCKGPEHVIGGMDGEVGIVHPDWGAEAWEVVRVVPVDVGDVKSLWSVRQAYQVFTEQMVQWGERNRRMSP